MVHHQSQGTEYSCAGRALHRTSPHPCPPTLLLRGEQQLKSGMLPTHQAMQPSIQIQVCLTRKMGDLFFSLFFFVQRCYPLTKPYSLGTVPPRGGGWSLFLILTKILYLLTATLAKFFLVANDAFTLRVLPKRTLHHHQCMSGRNSEKIKNSKTTTTMTMISHFGLALNTLKRAFLYKISSKPQ